MSHHKLREENKCQNCGYIVRKRFCPKCGQENIETRQSFSYLFTHFIEDFVHYDGSFWKTIRNLILKPGLLTIEYLKGKRQKYVAPVKLYIFLNFFVFFLGSLLSKVENHFTDTKQEIKTEINNTKNLSEVKSDTLSSPISNDSIKKKVDKNIFIYNISENSLAQYDSIQTSLSEDKKDNYFVYKAKAKALELSEKHTPKELTEKIINAFTSNFPKFLFAYMPVFAFFMWLFFNKRKWLYFDHGIFTLHYFSMVLTIVFIVSSIIIPLNNIIDILPINILAFVISSFSYLWIIFYYYKAIYKVYNLSKIQSFILGSILLFVNITFFIIGIIIYLFIIYFII